VVDGEDVEGFLTTLASSPGIGAWQVEQATDALTILLGSVFGQAWAATGEESMAFDEAVAGRIREALAGSPDVVEMKGLVYVEPAGFASAGDLKAWIARAMEFALSLPAK